MGNLYAETPWYKTTTFRLVVGTVVVVGSIALAVFCPPSVILSGAAMGSAMGAVTGGVIGGVTAVCHGENFLDGFADGYMWGSVSGTLGAVAEGVMAAIGGVAAKTGAALAARAVVAVCDGAVDAGVYAGQAKINDGDVTVGGVATTWITGAVMSFIGQSVTAAWNKPAVKDSTSIYDNFKKLAINEQVETFSRMSSEDIYALVKNSKSSWVTDTYDLITPENAKIFVKIADASADEITFNLDWPKYGGYEPSTISSIDDLSGKIFVSRDGGDGGYTMGLGKNPDGTYANNSQRSIPKSSSEVNTGRLDVDFYKTTVDIVSGSGSDIYKIDQLTDMGIDENIAEDLLKDYNNWLTRPEIVGENNILKGLETVGKNVNSQYGYYEKAAEWNIGGIEMCGGAGQMNTVYSWGTLKEAQIITDIGKEIIN